MLPLFYPLIVIALVVAASFLSFCKKWRVVVSLIIFTIVVNWWSECIPFRLWPLHEKAGSRSLRVLTLNISSKKRYIGHKSEELATLIGYCSFDIVYISELSTGNKQLLDSLLIKDLPYSLYFQMHGLYSKYPLSKRLAIGEEGNSKGGCIVKCLIYKEADTIAFYGCHLASNNYSANSKYITPDSINNHSTLIQYVKDINLAYSKRISAAGVINGDASKIDNPIIILGDMNDVGGSKTIRLFETIGLKDAWWEGGFGYGATIHKPLPYRIDHILYSNHLKLNNVKVVSSEGLSDHDALFAEFSY